MGFSHRRRTRYVWKQERRTGSSVCIRLIPFPSLLGATWYNKIHLNWGQAVYFAWDAVSPVLSNIHDSHFQNLWWEIFTIITQTITLCQIVKYTHPERKLWGPHTQIQTWNTYMTHGIWEVFLLRFYLLVTHTGVKYYMITSKGKRNNIFKTFSRHMSEDVMKNGMKNLWNHFKDRTRFHDFKSFSRGWKLMWLLHMSTNSSHIFLIIPCSILHKHQIIHCFAGRCGTFPA